MIGRLTAELRGKEALLATGVEELDAMSAGRVKAEGQVRVLEGNLRGIETKV